MTYGISAIDSNTARYVQSIQALDGLSNADVSSLYNQSIFGGGYGYSSIPFAGVSQDQILQYNRQAIDNNLTLSKQNRAASQLSTSSDDSISRQIAVLQRQIQANKQDNVMVEYNKLVAAVAQYYEDAGYTNVSEEQVKATAEKMYAQMTGNALITDIQAHGSSSFAQGFKKIVSFGLETGRTKNDNIEAITGEHVSDAKDKAGKIAGGATGVLTLAAAGKALYKFVKSPIGAKTMKALKNFILH